MATEPIDVTVYRLSGSAFELAQKAAASGHPDADLEAAAREINTSLDEAWAQLQATPSSDPGVTRAWSDARLDVGWVLSHGELSPSARLAQFLQAPPS